MTVYRCVNIKFENVNKIHNTICINSYIIHLPNKLSEQLDYYINIREKVQNDKIKSTDTLFIGADGNILSSKTALISSTLREFMGRGDLTGIIKFAVIQMISKGVNQSILQDFTKVGGNIYKYCQEKVNEDKSLSSSRYLDSKLRSLETFDML